MLACARVILRHFPAFAAVFGWSSHVLGFVGFV